MKLFRVVDRLGFIATRNVIALVSGKRCTQYLASYYRRRGMKVVGVPNFISPGTWFDGTDYSLIELNEGCTISAHVRLLTHDWALHTLVQGLGLEGERLSNDYPLGSLRPIRVGRHAFIGMGTTLMPGSDVGDFSIVGAGSVVRGKIPPFSIFAGNPAESVENVRDYICRSLKRAGEDTLLRQARAVFEEQGQKV